MTVENDIRKFIRLSLEEWSDETTIMPQEDRPIKDLEAPEDENEEARDPFSSANNKLSKSKAQAPQAQRAGVIRGSGRMGGGRFPGGPNQGVTGT